jgi:site-specific DNA-methyltransferase (adenine-specific)/adenine-specific DNA-methyltransferase
VPTLDWIGKKAVINHHRQVPYHLLRCDASLSAGDPDCGNLLVQGDNLLALKALLPYYAGKVKCIYIDPPYNTGNEKWVYNDAVNSPEMRNWLGKVVGAEAEDLSRHDKWLCMIYPRLQLLSQFLGDDGALFVSLDDNEVSQIRFVLDEVFGASNFVAHFIWEKRKSRENRRVFSFKHDFIVVYAKNKSRFESSRNLLPLSAVVLARYKNPDKDPRGPWQSVSANAQAGHGTEAQFYEFKTPGGKVIKSPPGRCWLYTKDKMEEEIRKGNIWFGKSGNNAPRVKKFLRDAEEGGGLTPETIWYADEVGTNDEAKKLLIEIFGEKDVFDNPKPPALIQRILQIATNPGDLVLDSFAGSGTTGHAVLAINKADGGNRRFILVEMDENVSRNVTAQRLSRVIDGYEREKGGAKELVQGLGGGFRYCTLGDALFDEGGNIRECVAFRELAAHIFFTETGSPIPKQVTSRSPFLGAHEGKGVYLLFNGVLGDKRADGGNVLTGEVLRKLPNHNGTKVIYGEGCRLGPARLKREGIIFKQIPYQIKVS